MSVLRILSAGAAKGLVNALASPFEAETGVRIEATFNSAGATRDAFEADGADLVILPEAMLDTLGTRGLVDAASIAVLGDVATGIAVRDGDDLAQIGDANALREALVAAPALYCPDTERSTAGIHFMRVLRALGIGARSHAKVRAYANGATAMAALATEGPAGALGCTQVTEILYTPGVTLAATLPAPFELSTRYAIGQAAPARSPEIARGFALRLTGLEAARLRQSGGFK